MDVNGLPMWLFAGAEAFGTMPGGSAAIAAADLAWNAERHHLTLAAQQQRPTLAENDALARLMLSRPSPVSDAAETFAWWNPDTQTIEASGFAPGTVALHLGPGGRAEVPPPLLAPSDMALGDDQILYVARDGKVLLRDVRERYPTAVAGRAGFSADLLAPLPGGGVWAFDRTRRALARVAGRALREQGLAPADTHRFAPLDPNPDPPRIEPVGGARLADRFDVVAIAASPGGRLALLAWEQGADAALFTFDEGSFVPRRRTAGVRLPWSLAWLGEDRVAVIASDGGGIARQALVYPTGSPSGTAELLPDGRVFLLREPWPARFCNRLGEDPAYLAAPPGSEGPALVRRLIPLSGVRYARSGGVLLGPIDSGREGCVWHRLYAEAAVPGDSRIRILVHAADGATTPELPGGGDAPAWAPHAIGRGRKPGPPVPTASWCDAASELPMAPPLLGCPRKPGEAGLFTVLLQHGERRVRRIVGRFAWLLILLDGDGRDTPELAALRLYADRFSYRDRYLPDFYSESLTGAEADESGRASPPDFLERLLGVFEGSLTELEGKVAHSWLLTDPAAAPDAALPWLGSWIGIDARPGERSTLLRQRLLAAPYTAPLHGTSGGLMAELELATGGRCFSASTPRDARRC